MDEQELIERKTKLADELQGLVQAFYEENGPESLTDAFDVHAAGIISILAMMPDWLRQDFMESFERKVLRAANQVGGAVGIIEGNAGTASTREEAMERANADTP